MDHETSQDSLYAGVGHSPKSGWYMSAISNGTGGPAIIALHAFTSSIPPLAFALGIAATCAAPLFALAGRRGTDLRWGPLMRIVWGMTLIGVGVFAVGSAAPAMAMLMLVATLTTAYVQPARISIPYTLVGMCILTVGLLVHSDVAATAVPVLVVGVLSAAAIVSQRQLRAVADMTSRLSSTDPLTGCANVRRLRTRLQELILDRRGHADPVTLFAADLDEFKRVNDAYSHTLGDQLLRAVAAAMHAELLAGDVLVRRGGDEFAVLCPALAGRDPDVLAARLRAAIHRARMEVCPHVTPTGSVGYAVHRDSEQLEAFLERADGALHEAKLEAHPERREATLSSLEDHRRRTHRQADHLSGAPADQLAEELRISRWAQRALGPTQAWIQAAAMTLVIGTTLAVYSISGAAPQMRGAASAAAIGVLLAATLPYAWAAWRELPRRLLLVAIAMTLVAMTVALVQAGGERVPLLYLFLIPILLAFYFLAARLAVGVTVAGLGLFVALLLTVSYPYTALCLVTTALAALVVGGLLAKARLVTRNYTKQAVEMSVVDPLTGLANLRGLRRRIADEVARSGTGAGHLALIAIDLDAFKAVNDRYSHTQGDELLVAVADAIRGQTRGADLIARRGGDEFAVACVCDDPDDVRHIAVRVADGIRAARLAAHPDMTATASVGYIVHVPGESADVFLARADRELHGAKERSHAAIRVA